jgi:glycosyltransferase involved in cell wall biosynthesis
MMGDLAIDRAPTDRRDHPLQRLLLFNLATDEKDPILGFTAEWVRALAARVPNVDVITMRSGTTDLPGNVRVYSIGKERGWTEARRLFEFYRRLGLLLHEQTYDACFAHMQERFALLAAPLLKLKHIPVTLWYTHPHTPLALRAAIRTVDRVITADSSSCRVRTSKLLAIGHGIDTDRFVPAFCDQSRFRVVAVGRVTPIKRLELLIDGAARVQSRLTQALEVRLIGPTDIVDTNYEAALRRRAFEKGIASQVNFVGPLGTEELIAEYQAADAVVGLTRRGSFDKSAIEGMSCGLPLLTMNPAFAPHLLAAGMPGPIVDGNAEALGQAIGRLADVSVEERRRWGLALRAEVVRAHSLQRLADLLVNQIL